MERRYEFIDLIVAIGLFATIVAGGLVFLAANGQLSLSSSRQSEREQPVDTSNGTRWLQPVLGQAILDHDLLDHHNRIVTPAAVTQLNEVTGEHVRWQNSPYGYLDSIKMVAARVEADHVTRVQTVLGPAIPTITLVVASVLLMWLFMAGLLVASALPMAKEVESGEFRDALPHPRGRRSYRPQTARVVGCLTGGVRW